MSRLCWNASKLSVIMSAVCDLCPHTCRIPEGQNGFCGVRTCRQGRIVSAAYGKISSMALDPIEKKPLRRFYPGTQILSIGSMGCNLRCPFCQNHEISMHSDAAFTDCMTPQEIVDTALRLKPQGNIGIAYTYNEPLINFEFILDTCRLARQQGLKNVIVTNGCIKEHKLLELLPHVDAVNIDIKAFHEAGYQRLQGDFKTVRRSVELAVKHTHVEITSLMVPGLQDDLQLIEQEAAWLASLNPDIVLHLTRFFPSYQMQKESATKKELILKAVAAASNWLNYVYAGNI